MATRCEIRPKGEMRCDSEISCRALFREINALRAAMRVSLVASTKRAFGGGKVLDAMKLESVVGRQRLREFPRAGQART